MISARFRDAVSHLPRTIVCCTIGQLGRIHQTAIERGELVIDLRELTLYDARSALAGACVEQRRNILLRPGRLAAGIEALLLNTSGPLSLVWPEPDHESALLSRFTAVYP
jgi:hypothetical protein